MYQLNITSSEVVAVGDSVSDILIFEEVGLPIAFNYDDSLHGKAKIYIKSNSLLTVIKHIIE